VDRATERLGRTIYWLVLAAVLISAANAVVRKAFNYSSNSFLEIQWYLFSVIFLFLAGYTLKSNEHVRIDIITGRLSARTRAAIDIFGTLFFLLPMAILIMWLSWPYSSIPMCATKSRRTPAGSSSGRRGSWYRSASSSSSSRRCPS
jgi:TRAP-type mannitol/chloroaromatic compound transport system permease small subunit